MTAPDTARPWLSVVMPFYRKLAEFERVVALNAPYWSRPGIEVVIALDDAADEPDLQRLLARFPAVCWTLLVNDRVHAWRPPSCAINAGVRHSAGRFVFVHSPESAYVGDAPALALHAAMQGERGVAVGRVGFARFAALPAGTAARIGRRAGRLVRASGARRPVPAHLLRLSVLRARGLRRGRRLRRIAGAVGR